LANLGPGVYLPEYWIVDPDLGRLEVFRLKETGYDLGVLLDRSSTLTSPSFSKVSIPLLPVFEPI